ncbi:MAG: DNA repair protein RecN [Negativicutes bacterium]|nr:DNA repair protein RecN [Negativicutes bacterium]MBP8628980.1 DNA repair protein RecN [Negativicutes bacterium]MBP9536918.1 DNA repair protein RecN [Negativicutes bacterium]MBP9949167.1 DNA repair protein RecN [Negativicutes bacterium]
MLKTLTVWNFALIEFINIEFSSGLNILTGETGAGKSILIDALSIILGAKASADNIRQSAEWMKVEAVFDCAENSDIKDLLETMDIVYEEDEIIVSRRYTVQNKNVITINGCQITLSNLKLLGHKLIDIHGQHENQALLKKDTYLNLVDAHNEEIKDRLKIYKEYYSKYQQTTKKLLDYKEKASEYAQRIDMLKWQVDEIYQAKLKPGEEEEHEAEIKLLSNSEKISEALQRSHDLLEKGDSGKRGINAYLAEVKKNLEYIVSFEEKFKQYLELINDVSIQLQECSLELRDYCYQLEFNPDKLNQLQTRMDLIYKLRKKYGVTITDILNYYNDAKTEITNIENYDQDIESLNKELAALEKDLLKSSVILTKLRKVTAEALAQEIQQHLTELGMPNSLVRMNVISTDKFNNTGVDKVEILFSANKGEELKPLSKVASGGELSRIALALKTIDAQIDSNGVMIFDEIDTGIGGKTAQMVADKIAIVAKHKQVLCITHLPQIACMADLHIYISKNVKEDKTVTEVSSLNYKERLAELARMASGDEVSKIALDNAKHMLQVAQEKKNLII